MIDQHTLVEAAGVFLAEKGLNVITNQYGAFLPNGTVIIKVVRTNFVYHVDFKNGVLNLQRSPISKGDSLPNGEYLSFRKITLDAFEPDAFEKMYSFIYEFE